MLREMEEEEEEEEVRVSHFIHEHPLTLMESDKGEQCYGCRRFFNIGVAAYGCKECGNKNILHQECIEMPREIRHPKHPQHTLLQKQGNGSQRCALCDSSISKIGYFCGSGCEFGLDLPCTPSVGLENVSDEKICIKHPSHSQHQLFLIRKRHTFNCDACGAMETGRSYICQYCQYCIHEKCAALPLIRDYHHHHHPLSLSFDLPPDYSKYLYTCDVCGKELLLSRWIYHCQMCRYIAHIKCVVKRSPLPKISSDTVDGDESIKFPVSKFHEQVIKPFVMRQRGEMFTPRGDQKYTFSKHRHELSLVSLSISEESSDDEYDIKSGQVSEIICDACTMPIIQNKGNSSSSDDDDKYSNYYMSCEECKFFLHMECFHLPTKLSSHPLHHKDDHTLILEISPRLNFETGCSICKFSMNGLFYSCTQCNFKADIKCVCLPNTIKHGAHPQHILLSKFWEYIKDVRRGFCSGCQCGILEGLLYKCGSCDFTLCGDCIILPEVSNQEGDKHPIPLRYDAHLNHPEGFYCDGCEKEMNPRKWMYHCRDCDTSYHPDCFPTTSPRFRNIKFGFQCNVSPGLHPHPLTLQLLTTKLHCDVCGHSLYAKAEGYQPGFQCSSCNFFMCDARCSSRHIRMSSAIE